MENQRKIVNHFKRDRINLKKQLKIVSSLYNDYLNAKFEVEDEIEKLHNQKIKVPLEMYKSIMIYQERIIYYDTLLNNPLLISSVDV